MAELTIYKNPIHTPTTITYLHAILALMTSVFTEANGVSELIAASFIFDLAFRETTAPLCAKFD